MSTLNESVSQFTLTNPGQDPSLSTFLAWVTLNPPKQVETPKGEPRSAQSATGQVWAYLDNLVGSSTPFTRKQACDALVGAGLNAATVATQYQRWAKTRGHVNPAPVVALPVPVVTK
jgi:hypothetical protein